MPATASVKRPANIRLSARMNGALNAHAKQLNVGKEALVRRAISNLLEEMDDLKVIEQRRGEHSFTLAEVRAELGL